MQEFCSINWPLLYESPHEGVHGYTINNNDSLLAAHPKPMSHCESLPTQAYKQVWKDIAKQKERNWQRTTQKQKNKNLEMQRWKENGDNREEKSHRDGKERKQRANLPQAVLPVHSHIHLIHPALRNSPRWNQQTHTWGRETETVYSSHHAQLCSWIFTLSLWLIIQ